MWGLRSRSILEPSWWASVGIQRAKGDLGLAAAACWRVGRSWLAPNLEIPGSSLLPALMEHRTPPPLLHQQNSGVAPGCRHRENLPAPPIRT